MSDKINRVIDTVVDGFKESAKIQHQITKTRHAVLLKSPSEANAEFKARHAYAKKPPIEKQQDELIALQNELATKGY